MLPTTGTKREGFHMQDVFGRWHKNPTSEGHFPSGGGNYYIVGVVPRRPSEMSELNFWRARGDPGASCEPVKPHSRVASFSSGQKPPKPRLLRRGGRFSIALL